MNYYRVLGVEPHAEPRQIKSAYRKLAKEFHPDVNRHDPNAEQLFQRIVEAYEVLSDRDGRAYYDSQLRQQSISRAQPKQGHVVYAHNPQYQDVWQNYLGAFEKPVPANYLSAWQQLPLVHKILLVVIAALIVASIFIYQNSSGIYIVPMLIFAIITTSWLYRMQHSLLTRQQRPAIVEITLIYIVTALVTAILSLPFLLMIIYF